MLRHSRRSLLGGVAGVAGLAAIGRVPGARLVQAQASAYEIVSFGPITEGVMAEGRYRPDFGSVVGIHANGSAFGSTPASAEKFFPSLFNPDGTVTKLKSGAFGGVVNGLNADGVAVGAVFENIAGLISDEEEGRLPAVWIDGELTRLELPADKRYDFSRVGGSATSVSDDGVVFGMANGHSVLWIDGAPNVLPTESSSGAIFTYNRITPGGMVLGYSWEYGDDGEVVYEYGVIEGATLTPFSMSGFGDAFITFAAVSSGDEILLRATPTDLPLANIVSAGTEPVVIDVRSDGVSFTAYGLNSNQDVVGFWRDGPHVEGGPAILQDGVITPLADLLPADHGLENLTVNGISDDGIISGSGWDADGGFHPVLLVPA